jgi:hypothetical protein
VSAFWAVEHLDVIEHISLGILPCAVGLSLDLHPPQQLEKVSAALSWRLPRRLMLPSMLLAFRKLCQSPLLNLLPWQSPIDQSEEFYPVGSIPKMAKASQAQVIAEGIELAEELAALAKMGVDLLQGYLLCRPQEPPA